MDLCHVDTVLRVAFEKVQGGDDMVIDLMSPMGGRIKMPHLFAYATAKLGFFDLLKFDLFKFKVLERTL